jgi:hypothetical protein
MLTFNPSIASIASVFISRWDVAVQKKVPDYLANKLGLIDEDMDDLDDTPNRNWKVSSRHPALNDVHEIEDYKND